MIDGKPGALSTIPVGSVLSGCDGKNTASWNFAQFKAYLEMTVAQKRHRSITFRLPSDYGRVQLKMSESRTRKSRSRSSSREPGHAVVPESGRMRPPDHLGQRTDIVWMISNDESLTVH